MNSLKEMNIINSNSFRNFWVIGQMKTDLYPHQKQKIKTDGDLHGMVQIFRLVSPFYSCQSMAMPLIGLWDH